MAEKGTSFKWGTVWGPNASKDAHLLHQERRPARQRARNVPKGKGGILVFEGGGGDAIIAVPAYSGVGAEREG